MKIIFNSVIRWRLSNYQEGTIQISITIEVCLNFTRGSSNIQLIMIQQERKNRTRQSVQVIQLKDAILAPKLITDQDTIIFRLPYARETEYKDCIK